MHFFPIASILLQLACVFFSAYFTYRAHFSIPVVVLMGLVGGLIFFICLQRQVLGLYLIIFFSSLFALPGRFLYIASPIGIIVELLTCGLWINILRDHLARKKVIHIFRNDAISIALACLLVYYILQLANPDMMSKVGWFFFLRKQVSFLLFYYISYSLFDSYNEIRAFLVYCFALVLLIALYGIKQQWMGLAFFEKRWLHNDHVSYLLFYQGGFLRKFSFLTDPAAFGVICSSMGLLSLILAIRNIEIRKRALLYGVSLICITAASYSGTRTCILMFVSGLVMYAMMTLNEKRTYLHIIALVFVSIFLLFGPFQDNPVITRIKTTLQSSSDASASLRAINRHSIQPYIHRHPFGGGLNTSSLEGMLYNPNHALAGFPPDSGYMKILLEQGWIGLALNLGFYFLIIKRGTDCYFKAVNPNIRSIYIGITVCLFSLVVGQYSQITIAQYPLILLYYSILAILIRLIDFDVQKKTAEEKTATGFQDAGRLVTGNM